MENTFENEEQNITFITEQKGVPQETNNLENSELPLDMQFHEGNIIAICMYTGLMFFSAWANIHMLYSLIRRRNSGSVGRVNLLLLNLTIADLLVTFLMMPMEIGWNATVSWLAGDLACRILSVFRVFGLYLSSFVIMCISIDRYFAITQPLGSLGAGMDRTKTNIVVAWVASAVCSTPQAAVFHVETHPQHTWYKQCATFNSFPTPNHELAYGLFGIVFMYVVPMLSSIFCYFHILYKLWSTSSTANNGDTLRRSSNNMMERAKMNTLKMALLTLVAFTVCWTPYNVLSLWFMFDKTSALEIDHRLQKALFVFACLNSCINPLIYSWFHVSPNRKLGCLNTTLVQDAVTGGLSAKRSFGGVSKQNLPSVAHEKEDHVVFVVENENVICLR